MSFIKNSESKVGKTVILTESKESCGGGFEKGSKVKITHEDSQRGYTFEDENGNRVIEAGFTGFKEV